MRAPGGICGPATWRTRGVSRGGAGAPRLRGRRRAVQEQERGQPRTARVHGGSRPAGGRRCRNCHPRAARGWRGRQPQGTKRGDRRAQVKSERMSAARTAIAAPAPPGPAGWPACGGSAAGTGRARPGRTSRPTAPTTSGRPLTTSWCRCCAGVRSANDVTDRSAPAPPPRHRSPCCGQHPPRRRHIDLRVSCC